MKKWLHVSQTEASCTDVPLLIEILPLYPNFDIATFFPSPDLKFVLRLLTPMLYPEYSLTTEMVSTPRRPAAQGTTSI